MQRKRRPMFNYMDRVQHMVTVNMRGIFMDWLVEVVVEYKLLSKTLNLSMSYIHRFLSVNPMSKSRLQLLDVILLLNLFPFVKKMFLRSLFGNNEVNVSLLPF